MRLVVVLACAVLSAGCFEFERLSRDYGRDLAQSTGGNDLTPPSDLGPSGDLLLVDLASATDLTNVDLVPPEPPDLKPYQLPDLFQSSDLFGFDSCAEPLPAHTDYLYVKADYLTVLGASDGTAVHPYVDLQSALSAVGSNNTGILVANGTYQLSATISGKKLAIHGGFFADPNDPTKYFGCRSLDATTTKIQAAVAGNPVLSIDSQSSVAIDRVTVTGKATSGLASDAPAISAVRVIDSEVNIIDSIVRSHSAVDAPGQKIFAIDIPPPPNLNTFNSRLELRRSYVEVPPNGLSIGDLRGIQSCAQRLKISDSVLRVAGKGSQVVAGVAHSSQVKCGTGTLDQLAEGAPFQLYRSRVEVIGDSQPRGVQLDHDVLGFDKRINDISRTAVLAYGAGAMAVNLMSEGTLRLLGCTLAGQLPVVTTVKGLGPADHVILDAKNNIFLGQPAVSCNKELSDVSGFQKNLFNILEDSKVVLSLGTGGAVTKQQMMGDAGTSDSIFADPKLTDGVHLDKTSPAVDAANSCWGTENETQKRDFEGQASPVNFTCDIGADELNP